MIIDQQVKVHSKSGSLQYILQIKGFTKTKAISKISREEFLNQANEEYRAKFGHDYAGIPWRSDLINDPRIGAKYLSMIKSRWASINQRTINGLYKDSVSAQANPQAKAYRAHDVRVEMTLDQFTAWMVDHKPEHDAIVDRGESSSIDRIDETKGYSIDNIRIISLHENIEKRLGKKCNVTNAHYKKLKAATNHRQYIKALKGIVENIEKIIEIGER